MKKPGIINARKSSEEHRQLRSVKGRKNMHKDKILRPLGIILGVSPI